jgi:hypothetical protein
MSKITNQELEALKKVARNSQQWDKLCSQIRRSRNGKYPSDWFEKVILANIRKAPEPDFTQSIST